MTKEEIIELAREAGMSEYNEIIGWCGQPVVLERFANLVAAKERERCALVCEGIDSLASSNPPMLCAKAIRNLQPGR